MAEACKALSQTASSVQKHAVWELPDSPVAAAQPGSDGHASNGHKSLTTREVDVLRLIAQGFSTKEIAQRLGISFKTVVCHRSHMHEKLGVHESASLVRFAVRCGLVPP